METKYSGFAHRLTELMGEQKKSVTDLKDAAKVTYEMARRYVMGTAFPRPEKLDAIVEWLGTNQALLVYGAQSKSAVVEVSNVNETTSETKGFFVPLISWVQAGLWTESNTTDETCEPYDWIEADETEPSPFAYALKVNNDSMVSETGVSFPEGTILICEPSQTADIGDFVIAKDVTNQKTTFKQLRHDGFNYFLLPLNRAYPTISIDNEYIRIVAKVIEYKYTIGGKL